MIERLLRRLAQALTKHRMPYMVIGGQAVLYYGFPRMTQDVDITLGVDTDAFPRVSSVCRSLGLPPAVKRPEEFVRKTHVLPTQETRSGLRVDFIFSNTSYERQAIRRSRRVRLGQTTLKIVSLEDLIIHKLVAGRPIDVEDIRVLMAKHLSRINSRYVRHWLKQFAALGTLRENPLKIFDKLRGQITRRRRFF